MRKILEAACNVCFRSIFLFFYKRKLFWKDLIIQVLIITADSKSKGSLSFQKNDGYQLCHMEQFKKIF